MMEVGLVLMVLSFIMMGVSLLVSSSSMGDRESMSPFECGFEPQGSSRLPFSLRFFLIAVIFLIFDLEVVLLLPMVMSLSVSSMLIWGLTGLMFILVLLVGLYHEWLQGALNWAE
uniref:NADH-ubiquinone oxidoreductase chain 3 n=1 Tax=Euborellia arcanum TaxID=1610841 RepID=A0A1J0M491_9NEOP|nr:NADH dehydrogenase subunit 3 [Euborellia arcanum]APD14849.1 NADH dehydrogenase subunit 3 [Euborellia arcanum]